MTEENERRSINPWVLLGAGLVAAGVATTVAIILWQNKPDRKARRLVGKSERLIDQITAALSELKQQAADANGR